MNSLLISVFAEVASSVFPEGASCAASDTTASTVTDWFTLATLKGIERSSARPPATSTPVRRAIAKPAAVTSTVYLPAGSPEIEKRPSSPVVALRTALPDSFFTSTDAFGITFPA